MTARMAGEKDRTEALDDIERFRELRRTRDPRLRDDMVLKYQGLAEKIARKYLGSGEPIEDLIQEGYLGLIKAVDRFDPEQGVQFNTYATHTIAGEIRHYLRDLSKLIQEPGWHAQLRYRVLKCHEKLQQKLGRTPEPAEIAQALDMTEESVRAVLQSGQVFQLESLDAPEDGSEEEGEAVLDRVEAPAPLIDTEVENRLVLRQAMRKLKKLERIVIYAFFYQEYSKTEIARKLGISVNYASYLVKRGLRNLKETIARADSQEPQLHLEQLKRELATTREQLRRLEPVDSETGLASSPRFLARLKEEINRAKRYHQQFATMVCEVSWPAEWSADRRQRTAQAVTRQLVAASREVDLLSRFDETTFVALLPHTGRPADVLVQRCQARMQQDPDLREVDFRFRVAAYPEDYATVEHFMQWMN